MKTRWVANIKGHVVVTAEKYGRLRDATKEFRRLFDLEKMPKNVVYKRIK